MDALDSTQFWNPRCYGLLPLQPDLSEPSMSDLPLPYPCFAPLRASASLDKLVDSSALLEGRIQPEVSDELWQVVDIRHWQPLASAIWRPYRSSEESRSVVLFADLNDRPLSLHDTYCNASVGIRSPL